MIVLEYRELAAFGRACAALGRAGVSAGCERSQVEGLPHRIWYDPGEVQSPEQAAACEIARELAQDDLVRTQNAPNLSFPL